MNVLETGDSVHVIAHVVSGEPCVQLLLWHRGATITGRRNIADYWDSDMQCPHMHACAYTLAIW